MYFPPEQVSILRAALGLWRSVVIDGQTTPSAAFMSNLEQQAGRAHVHGWFPPQLDEKSVKAHKTKLLRLESKLLHVERQSKVIKHWICRGELAEDVQDVDAALAVAGHWMDKANVADILGLPVFLGDDGLFYVIDLQAEAMLCDPDFAKEKVEEYLDELPEDGSEFEYSRAAAQCTVDELLKCVERHRVAIQRMFGPTEFPAAADVKENANEQLDRRPPGQLSGD